MVITFLLLPSLSFFWHWDLGLRHGIFCCNACTRTHLSMSNKIWRNCMGLKISAYMQELGQILDPKDKKRPQNPTATSEELGAKTGVWETIVHVPCTQHHLGVGKPPKPSLQPDPWTHPFSSVQLLSLVWLFATHGLQHARLPCPSPTPRAYWNSCPLSRWCHPTISFSVSPFSSRLQSFPASGSFSVSQFFTLGGQSIGVSASASVLSMNIQDWFPLGWTGWIFLQSKGLPRVFSNTTVEKHQFFGAQLSL